MAAKKPNKTLLLFGAIAIIAITIAFMEQPWREKADVPVSDTSIGSAAPDFTLTDLNGEFISLKEYRGKNVVLNFWASWCPPCREEMPAFQKLSEEAENLVVIGVNLQEEDEKIISFVEELGLSFPILKDPDESVKKTYGVITQPVTYFIDTKGIITDKKMGPLTVSEIEQKVEKLTSAVDLSIESNDEIKTLSDGTKYLLHPDKLLSGGVPKDGIPSIDNPKFISAQEASEWLPDDELGLGIVHKGEARFYPFRILVSHEIVNDFIQQDPVLITYCPLCFTGIAFLREIDGQAVEFGVSGKLYNSELVMYDRLSDSYWPQTLGKAMIGPLSGTSIEKLPTDTVLWGNWKNVHEDTLVLSTDTGYFRSYGGRNPYGDDGNFEDINLQFPLQNRDSRLAEYEIVYGIEVDGIFKAYAKRDLEELKEVSDTVNGANVLVIFDEALGSVRITADEKPLVHETLFWFAWAAFHPQTELFEK